MTTTRRQFLRSAGVAGLALPGVLRASLRGSNEDVRIGVAGFNGRGRGIIRDFHGMSGVRVTALCDVDSRLVARERAAFDKRDERVATFTDVREMLDSKEVDAVAVTTPNHWHSLMGIWACQAGKHAYVEKPVSHNVWEGRRLVQAQEHYNKIVVTGTQSRSSEGIREAVKRVRAGRYGAVRWAWGLCYKPRPSIGKTTAAQPIPKEIDWDLWCGPAPKEPLRRKKLHYDWHWQWPAGSGDIGNQGVHEMDLARWFLGEAGLPKSIQSVGGRLGYDDDGTTPNTLITRYGYDAAPMYFEVRGLPKRKGGGRAMDTVSGRSIGVIVHCEKARLVVSANDVRVFDHDGKQVEHLAGGNHMRNHYAAFIEAIRSGDQGRLTAPILEGHVSSALCHLGNIAYKVGGEQRFGKWAAASRDDATWDMISRGQGRHLDAHGLPQASTSVRVGSISCDPATETLSDGPSGSLRRAYRAPFVVPEAF